MRLVLLRLNPESVPATVACVHNVQALVRQHVAAIGRLINHIRIWTSMAQYSRVFEQESARIVSVALQPEGCENATHGARYCSASYQRQILVKLVRPCTLLLESSCSMDTHIRRFR